MLQRRKNCPIPIVPVIISSLSSNKHKLTETEYLREVRLGQAVSVDEALPPLELYPLPGEGACSEDGHAGADDAPAPARRGIEVDDATIERVVLRQRRLK